jgi:hypothetical protein
VGADDSLGEVQRTVESFEAYVRTLVGESATIERSSFSEGRVVILWVTPLNPSARRLAVVGQQWLQIEAGEYGECWELAYTAEDVQLARAIVQAVIAGRVVELLSLRRSEVQVTLATGEVVTETGYDTGLGWLPIPGWRKRAKVVRYEPCRAGDGAD